MSDAAWLWLGGAFLALLALADAAAYTRRPRASYRCPQCDVELVRCRSYLGADPMWMCGRCFMRVRAPA